jgi:hypothetical protein
MTFSRAPVIGDVLDQNARVREVELFLLDPVGE